MAFVQGTADVGFKRKAEENNEIILWHGLPLNSEMGRKQYELDMESKRKNEASSTKIIKSAEAAGIKAKGLADAAGMKAKGLAEAAGIKEVKKAEAFVMITHANANAKKTEADARKTEAEAKLLEFQLLQEQKAAGIVTDAKKSETVQDKESTKQKKPQTPQTIEKNRKRRENYAMKKLEKENAAEDL